MTTQTQKTDASAKVGMPTSESQTKTCEFCHGVGYERASVIYEGLGASDKRFCSHCEKGRKLYQAWRLEPKQKENYREHREKIVRRAIKISGLDDGFAEKKISDISISALRESAGAYVRNWEKIKPHGHGYYLWGTVGSGKTFVASVLAGELMREKLVEVLFIRMPETVKRVKRTFDHKGDDNDKKLFDRMREAELLVLDDLGVEKTSSWLKDEIYQIVDYRWRNKLPMIITSNQSLEDLSEIYGQQISSRLRGCCKSVQMLTDDQRQTKINLF